MVKLTLIPQKEREGKTCKVCGIQTSVKYVVEGDTAGGGKITIPAVCNMCALKLAMEGEIRYHVVV